MKYAHFIAQHYLSSFKVSSIWEFLLNKLDLMEEVQLCKYKFCYWILLMFLTTWKEICWSLNLMYPSKYWDMGPPAFLFCLFDCCQTPRKRLNQISEKKIFPFIEVWFYNIVNLNPYRRSQENHLTLMSFCGYIPRAILRTIFNEIKLSEGLCKCDSFW